MNPPVAGVDTRRILYVQPVAEVGGSDVALLRMVAGLDPARDRAFVVLPSDGPLTQALRAAGATIFIVPAMLRLTTTRGPGYHVRYLLAYPRAVLRLIRIIRRERIDLVHTNSLHAMHGFAAAWLARKPHVWHIREIVLQSRLFRAVQLFLARRFSDRIIAMSAAIAEQFGADAIVLRDGIDVERFHPRNGGDRIRAELSIPRDHRVAGVVCRLDHWKGVDVFLEAAAICHRRLAKTTFIVAGGEVDGREDVARQLIALADSLGVADAVRFTGWRYGPDEIAEVHAALDVFVLPSTWPEPYGLVLLEAMATGKPVVATRHGGPLEICVEGETALLITPRDEKALAEAMMTLLGDPAHAEAMGAMGRARIERDFDIRRHAEAIEQLYQSLVPNPRVLA